VLGFRVSKYILSKLGHLIFNSIRKLTAIKVMLIIIIIIIIIIINK